VLPIIAVDADGLPFLVRVDSVQTGSRLFNFSSQKLYVRLTLLP